MKKNKIVEEKKNNDMFDNLKNKIDDIVKIIAKFITNQWKYIILFLIGLLLGVTITILSNYGNIAKLDNGEDLVVSVTGLDITANSLYKDLKENFGLNEILIKLDKHILEDKYNDLKDEAETYADEYMDSLKSSYSENWSDFLSYYGFENENDLKTSLISQYYLNVTTTEYVEDQLTDNEINDYYTNTIVGDISISHILINFDYETDATEEEITTAEAAALEKANNIINQLNASDDPKTLFATLAKENSDDKDTKENGGDLGYVNASDYNYDSFSDAAYALKNINDYTQTALKTDTGYEIIIKTAKDKDKPALETVKATIIPILVSNKIESDSSLIIKAMMDLRKEYKLNFEEPTMKDAYNDLMAKNIEDALTSNKQ